MVFRIYRGKSNSQNLISTNGLQEWGAGIESTFYLSLGVRWNFWDGSSVKALYSFDVLGSWQNLISRSVWCLPPNLSWLDLLTILGSFRGCLELGPVHASLHEGTRKYFDRSLWIELLLWVSDPKHSTVYFGALSALSIAYESVRDICPFRLAFLLSAKCSQ
jgi:hypothetical protein